MGQSWPHRDTWPRPGRPGEPGQHLLPAQLVVRDADAGHQLDQARIDLAAADHAEVLDPLVYDPHLASSQWVTNLSEKICEKLVYMDPQTRALVHAQARSVWLRAGLERIGRARPGWPEPRS